MESKVTKTQKTKKTQTTKQKSKKTKKTDWRKIITTVLVIIWILAALHQFYINKVVPYLEQQQQQEIDNPQQTNQPNVNQYEIQDVSQLSIDIPEEVYKELQQLRYSGAAYKVINDGTPFFTETYETEFEFYSALDYLGRCGTAFANISPYTLPEGKRGDISKVKPSGWHSYNSKEIYGQVLDDNTQHIYNRSHLIAYSLADENANKLNLITGTRYMNVNMTDFESEVLNYVKTTGEHVLYRVTPIFEGNNLVANGVLMEAQSVEQPYVQFCVYLFNVQPLKDGTMVNIDYATGEIIR